MSEITLYHGDCLIEMNKIADKSVEMILCDLPYGTTQNSWDNIIPFDKMWEKVNRIIKDNACIAFFCDGLFQAKLMLSNEKKLEI